MERLQEKFTEYKFDERIDNYQLKNGIQRKDIIIDIQKNNDKQLSFCVLFVHNQWLTQQFQQNQNVKYQSRDYHYTPTFQMITKKGIQDCTQNLTKVLQMTDLNNKEWLYTLIKYIIKKYFESEQQNTDDSDDDDLSRCSPSKPVFRSPDEVSPVQPTKFKPYPHPGNVCWNCNGQLTILQNPKMNIVKMQNLQVVPSKIQSQNQLDSFYKSLLNTAKSEELNENFFFLNDANEDEDYHTQFDKDPLLFEDDHEDGSNIDYLNFKIGVNKVKKSNAEENDPLFQEQLIDNVKRNQIDDQYTKITVNEEDQQHIRLVCLIQQITCSKPKNNLDHEMNNRISIYNFQEECLEAENILIDFIKNLNINLDMCCFKSEKIFVSMLRIFMEKQNLQKVLDEQCTGHIDNPNYKVFYQFDKECQISINYLKNYFAKINREEMTSRKKINDILRDICLAIMIENYINFINIRFKALEILDKIKEFRLFHEQVNRKNIDYIQQQIYNNIDMQSFQRLDNILNSINELLNLVTFNDKTKQQLIGGQQVSVQNSHTTNKKVRKGSSSPKKCNCSEKRQKKIEETLYKIKINSYIEQISLFELINNQKKHIYSAILNESIQNLRKRKFFDNSRQLLKIMSFNYNLQIYFQTCKKLIQKFNNLKQDQQSDVAVSPPKKQQKSSQVIQCSICNSIVKGVALICKKCRHGGHFHHQKNWFKENKECALCDCQCYSAHQ